MAHSIFFRLILMVFSFWIVRHNDNYVSEWFYYVLILLYFIIYCYLKVNKKELLRLLWDYIFINAIIWNKELHDPMTFMLVIIPLINAINYTGGKPHLKLLSLLTLGTLLCHLRPFEPWIILPITALSGMYAISTIRYKRWNMEREITERVNSYFLDSNMLKPHHIYEAIIKELNTYFKYKEGQGIKRMSTYILRGNRLWLVNASEFLWDRIFDLDTKSVCKLKDKKEIRLDYGNEFIHMFYIPISNIEYVFTCNISKEKDILFPFKDFKDIMKSTFQKISILLCTEYRISERREQKFNEIKDSVLYVNQAVKVMHFIRNKMNPLTNLVAYHQEIDSINSDVRKKMEQRIKKEAIQADKDLSDVLKTADYLLDKSNNPFLGAQIQEISIIKIYVVVSEISERLMNQIVDTDETIRVENDTNMFVQSNLIECKIMFTDWINNIRKYSTGKSKISMYINEGKLIIHFENQYESNDNEIDKLLRDMNSKSKDAVLEGKEYGYGIYIIKSISKELGVEIIAYKKNDDVYKQLCLDFKFLIHERKERKENTNI